MKMRSIEMRIVTAHRHKAEKAFQFCRIRATPTDKYTNPYDSTRSAKNH